MLALEESYWCGGDGVEGRGGDGEVECGEGDLGVAESVVFEDAFVDEDLCAALLISGVVE